jgi:2-aminoadipate transaminase
LLEDGTFDTHLVDLRAEHLLRRDALDTALGRHIHADLLQWHAPDGGLYFWCRLGGRLQAAAVAARALDASVAFAPGHIFYADHAGDRELRLCFSSVSPARADLVAERLARSIDVVRRDNTGPTPMRLIQGRTTS